MTLVPKSAPPGGRILVVGGRGFVGAHVVRALLAAGASPVVFGPAMESDRLADLAGRFELVEGSVTSWADLQRAFAGGVQTVVSCAAFGVGRLGLVRSVEADAAAAMEVNVTGFGRLLDAAREAGVRRVVWTSSTTVYGPADVYGSRPVEEDAPVAPTTLYGLTKAMAEEVARFHRRRFGMETCGLRLPLVLGPGRWYDGAAAALIDLFRSVRSGRAATLAMHDEPIDLMHVTDAVHAVLTAVRHDGVLADHYNVAGLCARAGEIVQLLRTRRPGTAITFKPTAPVALLPPLTGARFNVATGFAASYDLPAFVGAMLEDQ